MTQEEKDELLENIRKQHEEDLETLIRYLDRKIKVFEETNNK